MLQHLLEYLLKFELNETKPSNHEVKVITSSGEFDAKVVDLPFYDKERLLVR